LLAGIAAWPLLAALLPALPDPIRFAITWVLFTAGPGVLASVWLTHDLDWLPRAIVTLGAGTAVTPLLIHALGRLGAVPAYPYLALALCGMGAALWTGRGPQRPATWSRLDVAACGALAALAIGTGAIAFVHRLSSIGGGVAVYGAYDSFDLTFYATWASEATHTVPPTASYYAGHQLNAAYYTQLVFAMVRRFAGVPLLSIYFRYAWPASLALGALTAFTMIRTLATTGTAALAVALILVGGDLSYLAAWLLPHETVQWDFLLWPTNFLAPTMEVLHFNTWAQTMPVFFTMIYAAIRGLQTRRWAWTILSGLLLGVLFQFKPFAFAILVASLVAAAALSFDWAARARFAVTVVLGLATAAPFVLGVSAMGEDRRSKLLVDLFLLPQRMLLKLDLIDPFTQAANRIAPAMVLRRPLYLLMATAVFLAIGPGVRWIGAGGVWRAMFNRRADGDSAGWRLLAWTVVAGVGVPFILVTDPYVDTLQFYQTGLYVLWVFTALALVDVATRRPLAGACLIAAVVAVSLPSSLHYLQLKWTDNRRPPLASLTAGEVQIAEYLRRIDPETTVILNDRPNDASLVPIVSERRIALGWGPKYYAVGSERRLADVNRFYGSASGDARAALDMLREVGVTHVIVHQDRDRVHPDVLAQLQLVVQTADHVALYAVTGL